MGSILHSSQVFRSESSLNGDSHDDGHFRGCLTPTYVPADQHAVLRAKQHLYFGINTSRQASRVAVRGHRLTHNELYPLLLCCGTGVACCTNAALPHLGRKSTKSTKRFTCLGFENIGSSNHPFRG